MSWCVVSDAEERKCLDLSGNATAHHVKGSLRCVRGLNSRDCMARIKVAGGTSTRFCAQMSESDSDAMLWFVFLSERDSRCSLHVCG